MSDSAKICILGQLEVKHCQMISSGRENEFGVNLDSLRAKKWLIFGHFEPILSPKSGILTGFSVVTCEMGLTIIKIIQNDGLFGSKEVKYAKIWVFQ